MWDDPFYVILGAIVLVLFAALMYQIYRLMRFQEAGTPFPASVRRCPDGWSLDAAGWCVIPAAPAASTTTTTRTTPAPLWSTTGSQPSAWSTTALVTAPAVVSNVGTIHTGDPTYRTLRDAVPAVHKPDPAKPGAFTTSDIVPADFRAGAVAIHFAAATDPAVLRKFCDTFGVFWDGVTVPP